MDIVLVLLFSLIVWFLGKIKYVERWLYIPLILLSVFLVMLIKNIVDSMTYVDNHPWLNGDQAGWFHPHEVGIFGLTYLLIVANSIYILVKASKKIKKPDIHHQVAG
jgi:hypothetical protein